MVTKAAQDRSDPDGAHGVAEPRGAERRASESTGVRLKAEQRRELLEDAAAELFARRGYEATTVEQICAAAGVSKPMLYRHFESKRELGRRLLERRRDELANAPLDEFMRRPATGSLLAMTDSWFAHVEAHPDSCRFLFRDITGDAELWELQLDLRRRQRSADMALLRELAPGIPEHELEPLGEAIRSSLYGVALWWLDHQSVPRATVVDVIFRLTSGLVADTAPTASEAPDAP